MCLKTNKPKGNNMADTDYKTPKERIDADFRKKLEGSATVFSPTNISSDCAYSSSAKGQTETGRSTFPENIQKGPSLAMIYSPSQAFEGLFDPCTALKNGTLFAGLEFPFGAASCGNFKTPGGRVS